MRFDHLEFELPGHARGLNAAIGTIEYRIEPSSKLPEANND